MATSGRTFISSFSISKIKNAIGKAFHASGIDNEDKLIAEITMRAVSYTHLGNTARMILSALSPSELCGVISSGNDKLLKTVKGIGLKTAQRIIVDLKDKIATSGVETVNSEMFANPANTEIHDEAVSALTMLGFAQAASQKVVAAILKEEPAAPVEKVIKLALKRL